MTLNLLDVNDSFTAQNGSNSYAVQPASGEVWAISCWLQVADNGGVGDDVYIYQHTDLADSTTMDSQLNDDSATALIENTVLSNDCYLHLKGVADGVGAGARQYKYRYQGWKYT